MIIRIMLALNTLRKSYIPEKNVFLTNDLVLRKIKCAFFDLDGTLYPSIPSTCLTNTALTLANTFLEGDKLRAFLKAYHMLYSDYSHSVSVLYGDFKTGELTSDPVIIRNGNGSMQVIEDTGVLFKLAFVRAGMRVGKADMLLHNARLAVLSARGATIPEVNDRLPALMESLHGAKKFIISNSPELTVEGILKLLRVYEAFNGIYGSCKKPLGLEPVLMHVLDTLKLDPSEAMYVGDNFGVEISVARSMGIPSLYVSRIASERLLHKLSDGVDDPALVVARTINDTGSYLGRR